MLRMGVPQTSNGEQLEAKIDNIKWFSDSPWLQLSNVNIGYVGPPFQTVNPQASYGRAFETTVSSQNPRDKLKRSVHKATRSVRWRSSDSHHAIFERVPERQDLLSSLFSWRRIQHRFRHTFASICTCRAGCTDSDIQLNTIPTIIHETITLAWEIIMRVYIYPTVRQAMAERALATRFARNCVLYPHPTQRSRALFT